MKILELDPDIRTELITRGITLVQRKKLQNQSPGQGDRSPGLHVSDIYGDLAIQLGYYDEEESKSFKNYRTVGLIWEQIIEDAMLELALEGAKREPLDFPELIRLGEIECCGIKMSPDAIDPIAWELSEFKCTWKSSNHEIDSPRHWTWIVQCKAYCHGLNMNTVIIHALFINGNYRGSGPIIKSWRLEFSEQEIQENWSMLMNHAKAKGWIK